MGWLCIYITTNLVENIITHMQNGKGQKEGDGLAQNKKISTTIAPLSTTIAHPSRPNPMVLSDPRGVCAQ